MSLFLEGYLDGQNEKWHFALNRYHFILRLKSHDSLSNHATMAANFMSFSLTGKVEYTDFSLE